MATIAPMATWKPFTDPKSTRGLTYDIVCAHTMVGRLQGSWDWANQDGNAYWHFGLGGSGELWQCVDLAYRSAANLDGNWHVIPIETEDKGPLFPAWSGSDVPAWTPAQVDKLVVLIAWLCVKYAIPPVVIPDTKPGRRGLAYHRQGINPWRVDGGELWSNANGKICPGDRRIAQFRNEVVPRVAALVEGDDMSAEDSERIKLLVTMIRDGKGSNGEPIDLDGVIQGAGQAIDDHGLPDAVAGIPTRDEYLRVADGEDTVRKALLELARRGANKASNNPEQELKLRLDTIEAKLDQLLAG